MRQLSIVPAIALLLAGCGGAQPANEVAANIAAEANAAGNVVGENVTARVAAMSDRERNVVFVRALIDAGLPCDGVTGSARLPDQDGKPMWRADCKAPGGSHLLTVTPDGTVQIVSRSDR
jgi:hypothetical protein